MLPFIPEERSRLPYGVEEISYDPITFDDDGFPNPGGYTVTLDLAKLDVKDQGVTWFGKPIHITKHHPFPKEVEIVKPQAMKIGRGLLDYLEDGNTIPYSPGETKQVDYELTPEEHAKFDALPGCTKEEIETAKKVLSKTLSKSKGSIDDIAEMMEKMWFEPKKDKRQVEFYTNDAGMKLFEDHVRKEFQDIKTETYNSMVDQFMKQVEIDNESSMFLGENRQRRS